MSVINRRFRYDAYVDLFNDPSPAEGAIGSTI